MRGKWGRIVSVKELFLFGIGNCCWVEVHEISSVRNKKSRRSRDRRSRCGVRYVNTDKKT